MRSRNVYRIASIFIYGSHLVFVDVTKRPMFCILFCVMGSGPGVHGREGDGERRGCAGCGPLPHLGGASKGDGGAVGRRLGCAAGRCRRLSLSLISLLFLPVPLRPGGPSDLFLLFIFTDVGQRTPPQPPVGPRSRNSHPIQT